MPECTKSYFNFHFFQTPPLGALPPDPRGGEGREGSERAGRGKRERREREGRGKFASLRQTLLGSRQGIQSTKNSAPIAMVQLRQTWSIYKSVWKGSWWNIKNVKVVLVQVIMTATSVHNTEYYLASWAFLSSSVRGLTSSVDSEKLACPLRVACNWASSSDFSNLPQLRRQSSTDNSSRTGDSYETQQLTVTENFMLPSITITLSLTSF